MKAKLLPALLLLLIIQSCRTETTVSKIEGIVTDSLKSPAPFASVDLISNNKVILSKMCDIDGKFIFDSLPDGEYDLKVYYNGFDTKEIKVIQIAESESKSLNVVLEKTTVAVIPEKEFELEQPPAISKTEEKSIIGDQIVTNSYSWSANVSSANGCMADGYINSGSYHQYETNKSDTYFQPGEQYDQIVENEFQSALSQPLSTFSIDVDKASYSNVRRILEGGQLPPADAVRIEEMINYFSYNYPKPQGEDILAMSTEATRCPWNNSNILLKIALKAKDFEDSKLPASNFVFLIDVSGSMDEPNRLPLVKRSLKILVNQLDADDRIGIVVYAGNAGVILEPVAGYQKDKIKNAIDNLEAGGSTAGGEGIMMAYQLASRNFDPKKNNRVILCTDGDFNVGVQSDGDLVSLIEKQRNKGIFLSVLGYGMGNYKDGKMEKLADKGNGNNFYIDDYMEAEKVLGREMKGSLYTLAKDVKLQVEFNPAIIKEYRLIGYENRILNTRDFDDDKKDAGELGAGQEVTALYELTPVSKKSTDNSDELRYHVLKPSDDTKIDEIGMIKFRYKKPLSDESKLYSQVISSNIQAFEKTSSDMQFAAAVTQYGMALRHSKFAGTSTFKSAMELAMKNKGIDESGDRAEFVKLCRQAITIAGELSAK